MWICNHCKEENQTNFETCWNCGANVDGTFPTNIEEFKKQRTDILGSVTTQGNNNQSSTQSNRLSFFDETINELSHGKINPQMVCPHCQTKGPVRTKRILKKVGISGAKATAAIFTGGLSLLATGLSKKDHVTEAHCDNCDSTWQF